MSLFFKLFTAAHVGLYRATNGAIGARMMGRDVVLLTTTGRKTGIARTTPLMSFDDAGTTFVIASAGGSPVHPAWFNNLVVNPTVTVQSGAKVYRAEARVVDEATRARLYAKVASEMSNFADYEKEAGGRKIPIVALDVKA